jgi:hypothetical protein
MARPKLLAPMRLRVIHPQSPTVLAMRAVQEVMVTLGHQIGPLQGYGLARSWNAPEDLDTFTAGKRTAFLRCSDCGMPGVLTPQLEQRGAALSLRCRGRRSNR